MKTSKLFLLTLLVFSFYVTFCSGLPIAKINGVYYSTVDKVYDHQMGTLTSANNVELDLPKLRGFSGYPYGGLADIDIIIGNMTDYSANCWRVSFNPPNVTGSRPYNLTYVTYYLENTPADWYVIVDGNHYVDAMTPNYPENETLCLERVDDILSNFPNNTRVLVELWNEPAWGWNTSDHAPTWIADVRGNHYTNGIVVTKFSPYFLAADSGSGFYDPWTLFTDTYDRIWQSFHIYMNLFPPRPTTGTHGLSYQDIIEYMGNASVAKVVFTELGAETDETPFAEVHVTELNGFLAYVDAWIYGYTIWYNGSPYTITAANGYDTWGLTLPLP